MTPGRYANARLEIITTFHDNKGRRRYCEEDSPRYCCWPWRHIGRSTQYRHWAAPVWRPSFRVTIARETAIIVWDPIAKLEYFIGRASLRTGAGDFGFLVPSPSRSTLADADKRGKYDERR